MTSFMPILLTIATLTGAGMILPQVVRVRRTGLVDGLSPAWVGVGLAMNVWWTAYAFEGGLWGLMPVSVLGFGFYADLARQLVRLTGGQAVQRVARGGASLGLVPVPFLLAAGWPGAGLAIGLCYGIQFIPAAVAALYSDRVNGISPTTWVLALIEAAIWLGYGTTIDDPALLVGGGGGTIMSTIILARLCAVARRTPRQPATYTDVALAA